MNAATCDIPCAHKQGEGQGKDCICCVNESRAIFGLAPIKPTPTKRQAAFNRATERYWSDESQDKPVWTTEDASYAAWAVIGFLAALIGVCLMVWLILSPPFRWSLAQLF